MASWRRRARSTRARSGWCSCGCGSTCSSSSACGRCLWSTAPCSSSRATRPFGCSCCTPPPAAASWRAAPLRRPCCVHNSSRAAVLRGEGGLGGSEPVWPWPHPALEPPPASQGLLNSLVYGCNDKTLQPYRSAASRLRHRLSSDPARIARTEPGAASGGAATALTQGGAQSSFSEALLQAAPPPPADEPQAEAAV